ncbi:leucine-rich repeat domain-containing protein [Fibrella arboris]|uniref:leucine-rich repeat domain-containing protein n=1 Tax=Fibrella arboris TaxID=3242486 RepID=UPI003520E657
MQGYRGHNCLRYMRTYLLGVWLICLAGGVMAQQAVNQPLVWYVPQPSLSTPFMANSAVIHYSSWTDLAEKLAHRPAQSFHLSLVLDQNTAADWRALRTVPPANSLSVMLADSVMGDSLLPILAAWPTLTKVELGGFTPPRSYTFVKNAKGETVFGTKEYAKRLAATGWERLRSVAEMIILEGVKTEEAIRVAEQLPALTSLTIRQYIDMAIKNEPIALGGLHRLRKLSIEGRMATRSYTEAFKGLANLTDLQITDPDVPQFNIGLTHMPTLRRLAITSMALSQLRLGGLQQLEELTLTNRFKNPPRRTATGQPATEPAPTTISLDSTLAGLTSLKRLSVAYTDLSTLPAGLLANTGLTYLSLPDAGLGTLPDEISQLKELNELILDNNPLRRLPDGLCRLPKLSRLSVSKCELSELPAAIGQLTSLTVLALDANQLTQLPASMGQLSKLRRLNVAMNQLTELPAELGKLPDLTIIAAFWNKISRFPSGFSHVNELYLSDNQLTELPASLGTLRRLRTLLLDNNPLAALPETIGQLDSLETLVLGENQLTTLPGSLGKLRRLRSLTIGANQLRALPESISGLVSLTSLSVQDNPIARLPASIGAWNQLQSIKLRLPQLESLPEQIGRWQSLQSLAVESDRLLTLPGELVDCQKLNDISVAGNRFIGLPEAIGQLRQLASLTVAGKADSLTGQGRGQLIALPASLVSCTALTSLTVKHQQRFDGVEALQLATRLAALEGLSLINCGLTDLTDVPWKQLPVLYLNLSQNQISQLPAALLTMPNLRQLNVSETNLPTIQNRVFIGRNQLADALKNEVPK